MNFKIDKEIYIMSKIMITTCDICGKTETTNLTENEVGTFDWLWSSTGEQDLDICQECIERIKKEANAKDKISNKHDPDEPVPVIEERYRKFEICPGDSESLFSDIFSAYENNPEISFLDMIIQIGLVDEDWPFPEEWNSVGWKKMPVCKFADDPRTYKTFIMLSEPNKFVK